MSIRDGDDLYQWASNEAFKCRDLRYGSMAALTRAIRKEYTPHGVESIDLHEPLDGNQYLWLHRRRMLPTLISMLKDPMFAGAQYTRFKMMRGENGCRIYGSFGGGQWYQFADTIAQSKAIDNEPVSVYPCIFSSDVTVGRKNVDLYPVISVPGCVEDDKRSEPGSWYLIAMFPHYRNQPAENAGRQAKGPLGYRRRRVELHHLSLDICMEDLNEISLNPLKMQWADGQIRPTYIMAAAYVVDQNEQDLVCCETSQKCKNCACPRNLLHDPPPNLPPRRGRDVQIAVLNAAFKGIVPGSSVRHRPLFRKDMDPLCGRERWFPTSYCTIARYEETRAALGGVHLVENALWKVRHYDYLVQAMKDSMHAHEHGTCDKMMEGSVVVVGNLQRDLKFRKMNNTLIKRLLKRMHVMCNSSKTQWVTMLRFSNQKVLLALAKHWQNYKKRQRGASSDGGHPMCDANDVAKAMLAMPFILDGLADKELKAFNASVSNPRARVRDPCPNMISAYNKFLHWYLMYRARNLTEDETQHLDVKGKEVLRTLVSAFPQHGVTLSDGTFRSAFCGEKPHSILHGGRNIRFMGRCKNYNTVAPETRHKQTKRKTHKTNNHFTIGMSILQNNMDEEAGRLLSFLHDKKGSISSSLSY
jgi:hypothetical protein